MGNKTERIFLQKQFFAKERESQFTPDEQAVFAWFREKNTDPRQRERNAVRFQMRDMDRFKSSYGKVKVEPNSVEERTLISIYGEERVRDILEKQEVVIDIVDLDKQWVEFMRSQSEQRDKTQRGELFEFMVEDAANYGWYGENCHVIQTSEYDDRWHKDLVFEWGGKDGKPIRLAVDCTTAKDETTILKKVERIVKRVKSGKLSSLKYFQSEYYPQKTGSVDYIPTIVLAVQPEKLDDLRNAYLKVLDDENGEAMSAHYMQIFLLEEMRMQLEIQRDIIEKLKWKNNNHTVAKQNIDAALGQIKSILQTKKSSVDQTIIQRALQEFTSSHLQDTFRSAALAKAA